MAESVSDSNFEEVVFKSDKPVLVDFWAKWCGPCRSLSPVIDELAAELGASLKVVKVDIDENPNIASKFNVRSIPTLIVFRGTEVLSQKLGAHSKSALVKWIEEVVA